MTKLLDVIDAFALRILDETQGQLQPMHRSIPIERFEYRVKPQHARDTSTYEFEHGPFTAYRGGVLDLYQIAAGKAKLDYSPSSRSYWMATTLASELGFIGGMGAMVLGKSTVAAFAAGTFLATSPVWGAVAVGAAVAFGIAAARVCWRRYALGQAAQLDDHLETVFRLARSAKKVTAGLSTREFYTAGPIPELDALKAHPRAISLTRRYVESFLKEAKPAMRPGFKYGDRLEPVQLYHPAYA